MDITTDNIQPYTSIMASLTSVLYSSSTNLNGMEINESSPTVSGNTDDMLSTDSHVFMGSFQTTNDDTFSETLTVESTTDTFNDSVLPYTTTAASQTSDLYSSYTTLGNDKDRSHIPNNTDTLSTASQTSTVSFQTSADRFFELSTFDVIKNTSSNTTRPFTTIMTSPTPDLYSSSTNLSNTNYDHSQNMNMTQQEIKEYLELLQNEEIQVYIPALVFIILIAVVGLFGNVLVLAVYKYKFRGTPTRIFIMTIAMFDIVANVISVPGSVYDMFTLWTYSTPVWCHLHRYIMLLATTSSGGILLPLCVSRYIKICRPFKKQVTIRHAKIASAAMILLGAISSIPYGIMRGIRTRPTPRSGIVGHQCEIGDDYINTIWPAVYGIYLFTLYVVNCVPLIIMYTLIGMKVFRHRNVYGRSVANHMEPARSGVSSYDHIQNKPNKGFWAKLVSKKKQKKYKVTTSCEIVDSNHSQALNPKDYAEECGPVKGEANVTEEKSGTSANKRENVTRSLQEVRFESGTKSTVNVSMARGLTSKLNSSPNEETQSKSTDTYSVSAVKSDGDDDTMADSNTWASDSNIGEGNASKMEDNNVIIDHHYDAEVSDSLEMQAARLKRAVSRETGLMKLDEKRQSVKDDDRENDEEDREDETNDITGREGNEHDETNKRQDNKSRRDFQRNATKMNVTRKQQNQKNKDGLNKPPAKKSNQRTFNKTTTMLFLITFVYIFSFVPHLALLFFRFAQPESFQAMGKLAQAVYHFFLRTYFVNSAGNAIIYSFCDNRFRREALNLLRRRK